MLPISGRALALTLAASGVAASGLVAGCQSAPAGPVTEAGALATGDRTLASGELMDSYPVRVAEGQWVRVDLRSAAFDPYLILKPPTGSASENDDAAEGDRAHAQITFRATEAGQVEIVATSYAPGEIGAYTLVYHVTDTEPAGATAAAPGLPPGHPPVAGSPPPDGAQGAAGGPGAPPASAPDADAPAEGVEI